MTEQDIKPSPPEYEAGAPGAGPSLTHMRQNVWSMSVQMKESHCSKGRVPPFQCNSFSQCKLGVSLMLQ